MTIRFDNRVAIVTGAGNGLGRAPTVEDVADNIDKIADLSTNKVFRTSSEEVAMVVGS